MYKNIDKPINIELISQNIGVSTTTLKRLFLEATGSSAGSFIRRIKMEYAFRSLKNKEDSILEIALQCGFEDASSFARSFKANFGYNPSFARNTINIMNELECISLKEPEIIEIDGFEIQKVTKKGLYFEAAPLAWKTLKEYLDKTVFNDDFTGNFIAIGHDNPHDVKVEENQTRFSAGVVHSMNNLNIENLAVPGGSYAKFNYIGKLNNMGLAYHYIYGTWSSKSSKQIDDNNSAFMLMDRFPDDFNEYYVGIYVPLIS